MPDNQRKRRIRALRRAIRIRECWRAIEDTNPGISTEMLIAMVCDQTGADTNQVVKAMEKAK